MAQWNKNEQDYLNQERTLHEVIMCADRYGNIGNCGGNSSASGTSAFGETVSVSPTVLAPEVTILPKWLSLLLSLDLLSIYIYILIIFFNVFIIFIYSYRYSIKIINNKIVIIIINYF